MITAALTLFRYLWAGPNTALGLCFCLLALVTGGGCRVHTGVVEAHGGLLTKALASLPFVPGGALALTLGHAVLAQTAAAHDLTRDHERVHVRQYERWGPLFLPAYVLAGVVAWSRGDDPYRGNCFEIEAYDHDTPRR